MLKRYFVKNLHAASLILSSFSIFIVYFDVDLVPCIICSGGQYSFLVPLWEFLYSCRAVIPGGAIPFVPLVAVRQKARYKHPHCAKEGFA